MRSQQTLSYVDLGVPLEARNLAFAWTVAVAYAVPVMGTSVRLMEGVVLCAPLIVNSAILGHNRNANNTRRRAVEPIMGIANACVFGMNAVKSQSWPWRFRQILLFNVALVFAYDAYEGNYQENTLKLTKLPFTYSTHFTTC